MIFAIDPGYEHSGWVAYDPNRPARPVVAAGINCNADILELIQESANGLSMDIGVGSRLGMEPWSLIAIEGMESHGMPWGTPAIEACWWGGRFDQHAVHHGLPVRVVKNVTVRRHLCGRGNVGGPAVRKALVKRFGGTRGIAVGKGTHAGPLYLIPGPGDHKWSALAVAITAAETKAEDVGKVYAAAQARKKRRKKRISKETKT